MRLSWILAGGLFLLTILFASMELEFLTTAAFLLLILVALAGHYKPDYAVARSDDKPPEVYSQADAPDPNDLEGGAHAKTSFSHEERAGGDHAEEHRHGAHHSPSERHLHDAAHSDKKHPPSKKHSPEQKHSEKQSAATDQKHSDKKHSDSSTHSDSQKKHFSPGQ